MHHFKTSLRSVTIHNNHCSRDIDGVLSGIRNISTKMNKSNACVLSAKHVYAIAGIRKELYIWQVSQCEGHAGFLKSKKLLAIFS